MTLSLIIHKVRGELAFDVAEAVPCVLCQPYESVTGDHVDSRRFQGDCDNCNTNGFIWQVPTSGHRAYPVWSASLSDFVRIEQDEVVQTTFAGGLIHKELEVPEDWPDHYTNRYHAGNPRVDEYRDVISDIDMAKSREFLQALGLVKPKEPIRRRV